MIVQKNNFVYPEKGEIGVSKYFIRRADLNE